MIRTELEGPGASAVVQGQPEADAQADDVRPKSCGSGEFLQAARRTDDGFAAHDTCDRWRIGAVVFARSGDQFAAVRKAPKTGYGFSGLWAMPGGMVRPQVDSTDFERVVQDALSTRAAAESNLTIRNFERAVGLGPVVTAYDVAGIRRHVVVMAYVAHLPHPDLLGVSDTSIAEAIWSEIPPDWIAFAPANRLILGHLLWASLDLAQRQSAESSLLAALDESTAAAEEIGAPVPAIPWADRASLEVWGASWPRRST